MGRQRKQFPLRACMPAVERGFADSSKQTLLAITLEVVVKPASAIAHLLWKWRTGSRSDIYHPSSYDAGLA